MKQFTRTVRRIGLRPYPFIRRFQYPVIIKSKWPGAIPTGKAIPLYGLRERNLSLHKEISAMFRSKPDFNRVIQALAGAFLLALIVAGFLGIAPVYAARSTTNATEKAPLISINSCAAGIQSSDYYLRQEEAILSKVIQSNWNPAEMASLSSSNSCAAGMQSSDYYLRQEEAILSIAIQSNWNPAVMASLSGFISIAQASP